MLIEIRRRMAENRENFNKELENIKKKQSELKNTIAKKKNILEGVKSIRWYGRIHKQHERQSNRNHPITTAKNKKKNFLRWG